MPKPPKEKKKPQVTGLVLEAAVDNNLTPRQTVLLKELVDDPARSPTKIMRKAGYKDGYIHHSHRQVLGHPKLQSALMQVLKTIDWDSNILDKYRQIIEMNPQEHGMLILKALDQIHKIRGDYSPAKSAHVNIDIPSLPLTPTKEE